jgi:hypothetical protein
MFNTGMFFFPILISCSGDQGSDLSEEPTDVFAAKGKTGWLKNICIIVLLFNYLMGFLLLRSQNYKIGLHTLINF